MERVCYIEGEILNKGIIEDKIESYGRTYYFINGYNKLLKEEQILPYDNETSWIESKKYRKRKYSYIFLLMTKERLELRQIKIYGRGMHFTISLLKQIPELLDFRYIYSPLKTQVFILSNEMIRTPQAGSKYIYREQNCFLKIDYNLKKNRLSIHPKYWTKCKDIDYYRSDIDIEISKEKEIQDYTGKDIRYLLGFMMYYHKYGVKTLLEEIYNRHNLNNYIEAKHDLLSYGDEIWGTGQY